MKTLATTIALSFAILVITPFSVVAATPSGAHDASSVASGQVAGEVRKIDKSAKKITIKHEAMKHLDMPAMTMVFQVKDEAMLDKVKKGDQVQFVVQKVEGQFTVTQIEPKP